MDVTLHIPDEFAQRLKAAGGDLSRRVLEALAIEEYKLGHLTTAELRGLLGLGTPADMDGFLKAHGVSVTATPAAEKLSGRTSPTRPPKVSGR
jgi:hypothetical protein